MQREGGPDVASAHRPLSEFRGTRPAPTPLYAPMVANAFHLRAGEARSGRPLSIFTDTVTVRVQGDDTGGRYTVMHGWTPPQGGPPLHRHHRDAETFQVLSSRFAFMLDGQRVEAGPGDTIHIPAGVVHQYQNIGPEPGEVLLVVEPAGLDRFFVELDALLREPGPPDMRRIAELHERYGMDLLGPPMGR